MYSENIQQLLENKNIETGDRIQVNGRKGRLMPKPGTGDPEILNLKLDSGYNIGLEPEEIELIEKNEDSGELDIDLKHSENKPNILVLHTGGTIASRVSYEEGGVKPAFDPEDLVQMYPELAEEVNLHSEVVAQMLSEDMEPGHWQDIAETIDEVKDDYDGIILGHGTDTMSWTGAGLSLMLQNLDTGVMIVGSQRSSDRPSTDAKMNMYCASRFLTETDFTGFGVCMHETSSDDTCNILPPQKVRKMHTSKRDAFKPINAEKLGSVNYQTGRIETNFDQDDEEYEKNTELDEEVGVLKVRPGMKPKEIEFLIEQDYSGVVIEGTGLGHMPVNAFDEKTQHHEDILEKLEKLSEDTVVVLASQCLDGRTDMNVYDAGIKIQDAGVIESQDMHPELAYVKLMWSLGQTDSMEDAKEVFQENVNGEISDRSMYEG
ncbi:Glu-tRNA(Gln) amidotransferase subunit GatD [Candidatus Nanohalobium constans]|uniref:Glutamyl-tRNA(Gln) amidotransferase subunit D n=1 Tax=Candidatus Nanohalobium constans TaxID=2565781 RepID=A0A5Q0UF81_9ARCH|nr:Glu-tRNA(Gln) amidotransferase subunit GatD [Candidatus Nanohalobium constans]QGA80227.1 glutamyl-tRNA(Gln) amidotransferase subunit D [Candidatus Nanohalobium constans]